ncbi:MAG TPA: aminoglycoside phosphotransferase family protein [Gemmatimonadaceae bacterium]|nr:aminoglycoside phosphotransferase family protein [Gemmatimonadaceae bacterium]
MTALEDRFVERLAAWQVQVERSFQTESSIIAFGHRADQRVVVKIVEREGDEWKSGAVLEAFDGRGVVRVLDHVEGSLLLERIEPGTPLTGLVLEGRDEEATAIIADVISRMSPKTAPAGTPTAVELGAAFARYRATGDSQIPGDLVSSAERVYRELGETQTSTRLLHGDLQHYNILFDSDRGWVAIDPKGIVGELEYELGASLRNPYELPDLFCDLIVARRRIDQYSRLLGLDATRILRWAFAQAVLSAIWGFEDGFRIPKDSVPIRLAHALAPGIEA